MSYAFGHLVGAWAAGKGYQYFSKKKISHLAWFFLLLGGILPDTDFLLDWTLGSDIHRTFTHSFIFLLLIPILVYVIFSIFKHPEKKQFALLIGLGISVHLFLDTFFGFGVPLFWPSVAHYSFVSGITPVVPEGSAFTGTADQIAHQLRLAILDMAIGTAWIFYLWFKKRVQF
ncbi:MAG TPA: metal-dependent hydrolase [Candidatus Nanoarchaeia archaeon]|nr:metal-dependent hydrolase [Candidatus Nanoarchaeia archaeon]